MKFMYIYIYTYMYIGIMEFTSDELSSSTSGFCTTKKIGEGGFGSVYRGTLRHTSVAIKRLSLVRI